MSGSANSKLRAAAKKVALGGLVAGGALLGTGASVSAACAAYPPAAPLTAGMVKVSNVTPEPGEAVTVSVNSCVVGDQVDMVFAGAQQAQACKGAPGGQTDNGAAAMGTAIMMINAPSETGVYVGSVALQDGSACGTFQVEVKGGVLPQQPQRPQTPTVPSVQTPTGVLPATGSEALPLLLSASLAAGVTGGALLFGARLRRNRATA